MASQINASKNVLPAELPSGIGGNALIYQEKITGGAQQRGGQGYGFEGKVIAPGVAEVSSYKGGSDMQHKMKRRQTKRHQMKRRQMKRRQNKSRR
jgi:hypothetical protein